MSRHALLACGWVDIALIGIALNLVVLIAAPILRPDLDLLDKSLSYYAVGPWGAVQAAAFVALGVASVALAVALLRNCGATGWHRVASVLLAISGFASLGLVWYPMGSPGPATILGDAHQTAGTIGGVAQLAAALAFALAVRADLEWSKLFPVTMAAFTVALIGAVLSQVAIWWPHLDVPMGATMRLLVLPLVLLWGFVALRLRRTCAAPGATTLSGDAK
jgi:hypothetical protein